MITYSATCGGDCGWSVEVGSLEERDRLDREHQQLHRKDPAGDYSDLPPQP